MSFKKLFRNLLVIFFTIMSFSYIKAGSASAVVINTVEVNSPKATLIGHFPEGPDQYEFEFTHQINGEVVSRADVDPIYITAISVTFKELEFITMFASVGDPDSEVQLTAIDSVSGQTVFQGNLAIACNENGDEISFVNPGGGGNNCSDRLSESK